MKKTSLRLIFDQFDHDIEVYEKLVAKIASAQRVISYKYEKLELLEAFALRLVTRWDVFVEDLLIACLNRDASKYAEHKGLQLRKHLSADECTAILTGLGYLDIRSVGDAQRVAKQNLVHNPFVAIPKGAKGKIEELLIIRNYLSHYSGSARRALETVYRQKYGLRNFREPGEFLWADTRPGNQMRFGTYIDALTEASSKMRTALGSLAR